MATVHVRGIQSNPGIGGRGPQGTVTVTVVVRSNELGRFEIDVHVPDHGDPSLNLNEARGALQSFSRSLTEALQQPLQFE